MVLLVGCAAEADEPGPITIDRNEMPTMATEGSGEPDVCELAAQLPADDICSLACDPTAMAAQLLADGSDPGTCYQLYCSLPGDAHVLVGVCLPP
jgi:hypothetical protein